MAKKKLDVEKLSIGEWLSLLTPGQVVGIASAVFGLLAVTFAAGWGIPQIAGDAELTRLTADNANLNQKVDGLMQQVLSLKDREKKETYLALYLRCLLAERGDDDQDKARAKADFTKFVSELYEQNQTDQKLQFSKGASRSGATITFPDGTNWPIPIDFLIESEELPPVVGDPEQLRKQAEELRNKLG